jgi:hypothetical protein
MINPDAGDKMASLSEVVNLGGKNPFEVDTTSKAEEASGVVVPIPT